MFDVINQKNDKYLKHVVIQGLICILKVLQYRDLNQNDDECKNTAEKYIISTIKLLQDLDIERVKNEQ